MGENQEKIETLEQSKQAEQDPTSEQSREGQHPEQPAPSREKEQQDEPPITEEEEELALELERFSTMYSTMAKMTIKMNDRLGLLLIFPVYTDLSDGDTAKYTLSTIYLHPVLPSLTFCIGD